MSEQVNLLGKGKILPWNNSMKMQFEIWEQYYADGTIERLMKLCNEIEIWLPVEKIK